MAEVRFPAGPRWLGLTSPLGRLHEGLGLIPGRASPWHRSPACVSRLFQPSLANSSLLEGTAPAWTPWHISPAREQQQGRSVPLWGLSEAEELPAGNVGFIWALQAAVTAVELRESLSFCSLSIPKCRDLMEFPLGHQGGFPVGRVPSASGCPRKVLSFSSSS